MKNKLFIHFLMLWLAAVGLSVNVRSQDPVQPPEGVAEDSEWLYGKHYEQVQEIMNLPVGERAARLENFYTKLPAGARMRQYMESFFAQVAQELQAAGQAEQANAVLTKMAELFPDSAASAGQQFQAAIQSQDYAKAIEVGEPLYASNPDDPQLTVLLAQSYIATGNTAKAAEFSQKAVNILGPEKGIYFVVWLADNAASQQNVEQAIQYYDQALDAYPQQTPEGWEAERWKGIQATAYAFKGSQAYKQNDYVKAIELYQESLKYFPKNEQAYLFVGLSHWRQQELDQAMDAFAKAVVLEKPGSAKAREYLEQIYKPRNNDSLEGLDTLLNKARQEVNP